MRLLPHCRFSGARRQSARWLPSCSDTCTSLKVDLRARLASALAFAARRLWRRRDLTDADEVILDLVTEALVRLGKLYRPQEGGRTASEALRHAPSHIRDLVERCEAVATAATPPGDQPSPGLPPTARLHSATDVVQGLPLPDAADIAIEDINMINPRIWAENKASE